MGWTWEIIWIIVIDRVKSHNSINFFTMPCTAVYMATKVYCQVNLFNSWKVYSGNIKCYPLGGFILSMVILRAEDLGLRTMQTAMKFIVKRFKAAERVVLCQLTRCYFWTNT